MAADPGVVYITPENYLYYSDNFDYCYELIDNDLQYLVEESMNQVTITFPPSGMNKWASEHVNTYSLPSDAIYLLTTSDAWAQIQAGTFVIGYVPQDTTVHFKTGTFAEYTSADKDSNSLYFIADKGIYKGDQQLVSVNADLTVDNTNKNIILNINGNQISASVSQDILDQIADAGIDIGEIPELSYLIVNPNTNYEVYYDYSNNDGKRYFKVNNDYYEMTHAEKDLRNWPNDDYAYILGSNIANNHIDKYSGNTSTFTKVGIDGRAIEIVSLEPEMNPEYYDESYSIVNGYPIFFYSEMDTDDIDNILAKFFVYDANTAWNPESGSAELCWSLGFLIDFIDFNNDMNGDTRYFYEYLIVDSNNKLLFDMDSFIINFGLVSEDLVDLQLNNYASLDFNLTDCLYTYLNGMYDKTLDEVISLEDNLPSHLLYNFTNELWYCPINNTIYRKLQSDNYVPDIHEGYILHSKILNNQYFFPPDAFFNQSVSISSQYYLNENYIPSLIPLTETIYNNIKNNS